MAALAAVVRGAGVVVVAGCAVGCREIGGAIGTGAVAALLTAANGVCLTAHRTGGEGRAGAVDRGAGSDAAGLAVRVVVATGGTAADAVGAEAAEALVGGDAGLAEIELACAGSVAGAVGTLVGGIAGAGHGRAAALAAAQITGLASVVARPIAAQAVDAEAAEAIAGDRARDAEIGGAHSGAVARTVGALVAWIAASGHGPAAALVPDDVARLAQAIACLLYTSPSPRD